MVSTHALILDPLSISSCFSKLFLVIAKLILLLVCGAGGFDDEVDDDENIDDDFDIIVVNANVDELTFFSAEINTFCFVIDSKKKTEQDNKNRGT